MASIGIDFGTTNSSVAVWVNDTIEIIQNELDNWQTPSYVAFTDQGILLGESALNQIHRNPLNTVFDIKRLMGRRFSEQDVQIAMLDFPFKLEAGINDKLLIVVHYQGKIQKFLPEEICSMILENLKKTADVHLGKPVSSAVISVPAYFNDLQRQAIREAGTRIGLNILRIINESTASAIAYNLDRSIHQEQHVLVFDLGSKKLDLNLLFIEDGIFEMKENLTNNKLGGIEFDNKLIEYCCTQLLNKKGIDIRNNLKSLQRLRIQCEKAKKVLSSADQATIEIDNFHNNEDFIITITKPNFEMLCMNLFKQCIQSIDRILMNQNLLKNQINEVILVGGSAKIPKIQELLKDYFNGKQLYQSINPEEVVAHGAATQAAILTGQLHQQIQLCCIFDVTILNLGIETSGGLMTTLIARNTTIPTKKTQIFTTKNDYQTEVQIKIYFGYRYLTKDCLFLEQFNLTGISPALKGVPEILITSEIDQNDTLTLTAQDLTSKNSNSIIIANFINGLTSDYIEKHILDAEKLEEEDKMIKSRIEDKNNLESTIYLNRNIIHNEKFNLKFSNCEKSQYQLIVNETIQWIHKNPNVDVKEYQIKLQKLEEVQQQLNQQFCLDDNDSQQAKAWFERSVKFSLGRDQDYLNELQC
ncbi:unnamed protein product [Paramecium octaurelia]|uniref:Heat shock protein 70 n=1 Tax=Paramecium octaurelia TaxID=43137 RepID=A0A8S1YCR3_PAROT|nr:unnamed protein product [Paramecium octaurelia]